MIQVGNFFPFFKFFQSRKEKHFLRCCYLVESLRSNEGRHRTIRAQHVSINRIKNRWIDFIERERERERESWWMRGRREINIFMGLIGIGKGC